MADQIKVCVGMPVFNGERFIGHSIKSILAQTLGDFELIIFDNASTDGTEDICRGFAKTDPRVRYTRNASNLGADPNYNLCLGDAKGRYFKWAAHDDLLIEDYLERCVAALDAAPEAVLCHSRVRIIDAQGHNLGEYNDEYASAGASLARPSQRFAPVVLQSRLCTEIFGVIRTDVLRRTQLHRGFYNSDRVLLAELALLGRFISVDEVLFENRDHDQRYVRSDRLTNQRAWHNTARANRLVLPHLEMWWGLARMVDQHVVDWREKIKCYGVVVRWWLVNWNLFRAAADPICVVCPKFFKHLEQLKHKLVGPSAHNAVNQPSSPRELL